MAWLSEFLLPQNFRMFCYWLTEVDCVPVSCSIVKMLGVPEICYAGRVEQWKGSES